jgi:endonuclease YncB( thermonuclease family)
MSVLLLGTFLPLFAHAAATRPWVTLTNCHYIETKEADGDSFRVRTPTNEFNLRLYFVDAPEATLTYAERVRQQAEHFHVTLDVALKTGARARERTRELLRSPFVVHTRWATAGGRGREARYYAVVMVGGRTLGEVLVSEGLAQPKGVMANLPDGRKGAAHVEQLLALEAEAKAKQAGAWTNANFKATP